MTFEYSYYNYSNYRVSMPFTLVAIGSEPHPENPYHQLDPLCLEILEDQTCSGGCVKAEFPLCSIGPHFCDIDGVAEAEEAEAGPKVGVHCSYAFGLEGRIICC